MATYNKKLKTIVVHLLLDDANPITIEDTADDNKATRALNEFKKYGTMHFEEDQGGMLITNGIPYHAVQYIEVTEADGSVERANPYGCEGGSDSEKVTITFDACREAPEHSDVPSPITVAKGTTVTFPTIHTGINTGVWVSESCDACDSALRPSVQEGEEFTVTESATWYFTAFCM